ncbi:MAG: hypothetical protein IH857_08480 [Deltaproteobacteria bacterium]|nr:hypothetical protein [Deltaproteobacteria bacterium]
MRGIKIVGKRVITTVMRLVTQKSRTINMIPLVQTGFQCPHHTSVEQKEGEKNSAKTFHKKYSCQFIS